MLPAWIPRTSPVTKILAHCTWPPGAEHWQPWHSPATDHCGYSILSATEAGNFAKALEYSEKARCRFEEQGNAEREITRVSLLLNMFCDGRQGGEGVRSFDPLCLQAYKLDPRSTEAGAASLFGLCGFFCSKAMGNIGAVCRQQGNFQAEIPRTLKAN